MKICFVFYMLLVNRVDKDLRILTEILATFKAFILGTEKALPAPRSP